MTKNDFNCYPETKIEEMENKLVFHLSMPVRWVIGVSLKEKTVERLVLTKGTYYVTGVTISNNKYEVSLEKKYILCYE